MNLWVFDENKGKRAPAFDYFIKRQFVNVVKTNENKGRKIVVENEETVLFLSLCIKKVCITVAYDSAECFTLRKKV